MAWPLEEYDDRQLNELLFPSARGRKPIRRAGVDFDEVLRQLKIHRHLTLQLVWEEYRETHPDGYGYSRFCELYHQWSRNHNVVLRQEHRPGEKIFVDWAGRTFPIHDARPGEARPASLFIGVLGHSAYTFARATLSQDLPPTYDRAPLCFPQRAEFPGAADQRYEDCFAEGGKGIGHHLRITVDLSHAGVFRAGTGVPSADAGDLPVKTGARFRDASR